MTWEAFARGRVLQIAEAIKDVGVRASFVRRVPESAGARAGAGLDQGETP